MANGFSGTPDIILPQDNLPQLILQKRGMDQRAEIQQQRMEQQQRQRRDNEFAKLMDYQPEKVWDPYNKHVQDRANQVRAWTLEQFNQGVDPFNPQFRTQLAALKGQISNDAANVGISKTEFTENDQAIDANVMYDPETKERLKSQNRDVWFTPEGTAKQDPGTVDYKQARSVRDDVSQYNEQLVTKTFIDDLPDFINKQFGQIVNKAGGHQGTIQSIKGKALYFEDGKPYINPETGTYDIKVTDDVVVAAKNYPGMDKYLQHYKDQNGHASDKEALTAMLRPYMRGVQVQRTLGAGLSKPRKADSKAGGFSIPKEAVEVRYDIVRKSIFGTDDRALAAASDPDKGIRVEYEAPTGPGEKRPRAIKITQRTGKNRRGEPVYSTTYLQLETEQDKINAMFKINDMIDNRQRSASRQTVGTDNLELFHRDFLKGGQDLYGGILGEQKETEVGTRSDTGNVY